MPAVINDFDSRAAKFFVGFSFMLATIGNQIAAGTYPFSNDVTGLCPKYINIFRATLIISIFCIVCTPWNIIKNAAGLLAFLSGYSCVMGPMAGVMVSDFYLVKNRKLDIHELYKDHGIYHYTYGINWRAFTAFGAGFVPLIPGFSKSIRPGLNVGGSWKVSIRESAASSSILTIYVLDIYVCLAVWVYHIGLDILCHLPVYLAAARCSCR